MADGLSGFDVTFWGGFPGTIDEKRMTKQT